MGFWPTSFYEARTRANRPGVVFNDTDSVRLYAEDIDAIEDELYGIESYLVATFLNVVTDKVKNREFDRFQFSPNEAVLAATGAAVINTTTGSYAVFKTIDFEDAQTRTVHFSCRVPRGFIVSSITVKIDYILGTTTNAYINDAIAFRATKDNEAIDISYSEITAQADRVFGSATHSAGDLFHATYQKSNPAIEEGDLIFFRYRRYGGNAGDTVGETVKMLNFCVEFNSNI